MSQDLSLFSLFQRKCGKVNYRGKCFVRDSLSICFHWYQYSTLLRALPGSVLREWYQNLVPISNEMKWSLKSDSFCSFIYSGVLGCTAATSWVWQWPFPGGWGILQDSIMHSSLCEGLFFYWWEIRISQSQLLEIVVAFFQFFSSWFESYKPNITSEPRWEQAGHWFISHHVLLSQPHPGDLLGSSVLLWDPQSISQGRRSSPILGITGSADGFQATAQSNCCLRLLMTQMLTFCWHNLQ